MDTGNDENTLSIDNDLDDDQNDTLSSDMDWDSEYELGSRYAMGPSELWELLPKAGMIYPFESNMPLNEDADFDAPLVPDLDTCMLDSLFASIFEEATDLLKAENGEMAAFKDDIVAFMASLRLRPSLRPWARRFKADSFVELFLILRAARRNWNKTESQLVTEHPCTLARAIDAFHAVERLDWGSERFAYWLVNNIWSDLMSELHIENQEAVRAECEAQDAAWAKEEERRMEALGKNEG